ncbi:MAG: hypothetical protein R3D58_08605 [Saprospiraceae bacterium]
MFTQALTNPRGINAQAAWDAHFQTALTTLQAANPDALDQALAASLTEWETGSGGLATDPSYQASERYCIRQSYLWQLYAAIEQLGKGAAVSRTIFNRAKDVLEETPPAAQPADRSFLEGDNLIRRTLEHLRQVAIFYPAAIRAASGLESASPPLDPSPGFQALTLLDADADPAQAEKTLQRLWADNGRVRAILLGADATADSADILDNCIFDPGAGLATGHALWVKSYTLLRASISTWLGAEIPHDYLQVRCIFLSPRGKPTDLIAVGAPFDFVTVSLKIVQAAQADDGGNS